MDAIPTTAQETRIVTFKMDGDEYDRLAALARKEDRSVSAVIRLAVRDYVDREAPEAAA